MARTSLVPQQQVFLSEADRERLAAMDRQREEFNAAVERYNQSMMGTGGYNDQLNAYIAQLRDIEANPYETVKPVKATAASRLGYFYELPSGVTGSAAQLEAQGYTVSGTGPGAMISVPRALPTAPTKLEAPKAPFTEEAFTKAQEEAQARAQEAAGQRAVAIQAFEDPSKFGLSGFSGISTLGSRSFAKGGEVKEEGTKASRMMKELGFAKPPKEKTLADEPSKLTPETLAYSLRAQSEGNKDKDLRRGSFSAPGALAVKRFEEGGDVSRETSEDVQFFAGSMTPPGTPEHERLRADTAGFIKRMDDASVMATASRMTGLPFNSPTQARLMLEKMLGGDTSVLAGVSGMGKTLPERVVSYDVGAKFPALGGQMSVGATIPRGPGSPAFNLGYRRQFSEGGDVSRETSESRSYLDELDAKDDPIRSGKPLRSRTRKPATQRENEALSQAVLQGAANMPYNILGAPGDIANILAAPTGKQPFYGSESAKELATQLGIRPPPPTDPTQAALYGAADIGSALVNPSAPVRAAARGAEALGQGLSTAAKDFQAYNRALSVPGASYAVKPPSGQWLSGSPKEDLREVFGSYDLMSPGFPRGSGNRPLEDVQAEMRRTYPPETLANMSEETQRHVRRSIGDLENRIAIKRWIDGNLTNYIKKDMGTPDDPLRKLGEQGITHLPKSDIESGLWLSDSVLDTRRAQGFPEAGFSSGRDESRAWENLADEAIFVAKPSDLRARARQQNPWVEKLQDPNTPLYSLGTQGFRQLGFDHVVDVLAEDLASGRLKPSQLNKLSVEQAVRRTHEYDEALRIAMEKAQAARREGLPVYKTYPETNYRWIQLNKPGSFAMESEAMGHSVRGYEPPKGHPDWVPESGDKGRENYGHGGWEAIKSGKALVYSLVDEKGLPHTTIEMRAPRQDLGEQAPVITQVKGKQNSAPNDEYLPYVQDFVRSGEYPIVGDFGHTGFRFEAMEIFDADQIAKLQASNVKVPRYMTAQDAEELNNTLYRIETGNDPITGMPLQRAHGGPVNKHDAFIKAKQ